MKTIPSLRHYLRLERFVHPDDDFVTTDGEWVEVCRLWAAVKTTRAEQRVANALVDRVITHTITTRFDPRVLMTNESLQFVDVNCSDKVYNIAGFVNVDELDDQIEWECVEMRA